jgi:O-antigen/teichoic acid export membrane protein
MARSAVTVCWSRPISAEAARGGGTLTERAAWLMAAKTLAMMCTVALPLFLVRHMTQQEFGLYKQAFLVITTAYTILPLGFSLSSFYFFPREPDRKAAVVLHIVLFHALVGAFAAVLFVSNPGLLSALFQHGDLETHATAMALLMFLMCACTFLEFVAIANQETRLAAILIAVIQVTRAASLIAAAVFWGTLTSLLVAASLHAVLQLGISLAYTRSRFRRFWAGFDRQLLLAQLAYALPYGAAALLWWVRLDLHHYFVAYQFSAADYAIYAVGCFQLPLLGILRESVGSVMIPTVSELQKESRSRAILELIASSSRRLAAFYLPVAAGAILLAHEIIILLFTAQYDASVPIFVINAALIPLAILAIASDAVIRAYAQYRYYVLKVRLVLTAILVPGLWLMIDRFGLLGAIGMVAISELTERVVMGIKTGAIVGFRRRDIGLFSDVGKIAIATAVATAVAIAVRAVLLDAPVIVVLAGATACFGAAYALMLLALRVPTAEELAFVRRQLAWLRAPLQSVRERAARSEGRESVQPTAERLASGARD